MSINLVQKLAMCHWLKLWNLQNKYSTPISYKIREVDAGHKYVMSSIYSWTINIQSKLRDQEKPREHDPQELPRGSLHRNF